MATDLDRRVEELASKQHSVFSVGQVLLLKGSRASHRAAAALYGLPTTSPARTLCDLTAVTDELRVERATDAALRTGVVTPRALETALAELAGPGRRRTRAFAAIVVPRLKGYVPPESELEVRLSASIGLETHGSKLLGGGSAA